MDVVRNNTQHDHHCTKQPNHQPDILPRVFDVVAGAAAVLALLSDHEESQNPTFVSSGSAMDCFASLAITLAVLLQLPTSSKLAPDDYLDFLVSWVVWLVREERRLKEFAIECINEWFCGFARAV